MRFLLARTDALGDLMVSLPLIERILSRDPASEIHFLVAPYTAAVIKGMPGVAGVHLRGEDKALRPLFQDLKPDAVLTLSHRDRAITTMAKAAGVPIRVARPRGLDQILAATHLLWRGRSGVWRHEAENALDFLAPWGWQGGLPSIPLLYISDLEKELGQAELAAIPNPRLGVFTQGSGAGAFPSPSWWEKALPILSNAGWNPVVLGPPEASPLPPTDLRGLMGRIQACDAILSPSPGPAHLAGALHIPLLCLMGLRANHAPHRWAPMGSQVQVLQYSGPEADLSGGMDLLDPLALIPPLARFR